MASAQILTQKTSWESWIFAVKDQAEQDELWQYIDPSLEKEPSFPVKPVPQSYLQEIQPGATKFTDLEDKGLITYAQRQHAQALTEWHRLHDAFKVIAKLVVNYAKDNYFEDIEPHKTTWARLRALQSRLDPTTKEREMEYRRQWTEVTLGIPKDGPFENWIENFTNIHKRCVRLDMPEVHGDRAYMAFIRAIKDRLQDNAWAEGEKRDYEKAVSNDKPSLTDLIKRYRYRRNEERSEKTGSKRVHNQAFSASFQGHTNEAEQDDPDPSPAKKTKETPCRHRRAMCLCGEIHFFEACPYIIRALGEAKARTGWKEDPAVRKAVDKKIIGSNALRRAVRNARKKAAEDLKALSDTSVKQETETRVSEIEDEEDRPTARVESRVAAVISRVAISASNHLQHLKAADSGSDGHVWNNSQEITITKQAQPGDVIMAGETLVPIEGFGIVDMPVKSPTGAIKIMRLTDVALVPTFFTSVVSVDRLKAARYEVSTWKNCIIDHGSEGGKDLGDVFCSMWQPPQGGHWILSTSAMFDSERVHRNNCINTSITTMAAKRKRSESPLRRRQAFRPSKQRKITPADQWTWHRRMGHIGYDAMKHLEENTIGVKIWPPLQPFTTNDCEVCSTSKAHRLPSRHSDGTPTTEAFERISWDQVFEVTAYNGDYYVGHFVDHVSHFQFVFTYESKTEILKTFETVINLVRTRFKKQVRYFKLDGETSLGREFDDLMRKHGITVERNAPDTPDQNGRAERHGKMLQEKARAMRTNANLPEDLFPEIYCAAGHEANRTPVKGLRNKTPYENATDHPPTMFHILTYGCRAYPLKKGAMAHPKKEKLQPRAHIGYLVGYDSTNIYRIWIPSRNKVIRTRDVTFREDLFFDPRELDLGHIVKDDEIRESITVLPSMHCVICAREFMIND
jgi:hypothetical protein